MINFRTEVELPKIHRQLSYRQNALMVGSCFTDNIGNYLSSHYFPVQTNPCGILYNPASIATCIDFLVKGKQLDPSDLFFANGLWNSFHFHSRYSNYNKDKALAAMNESLSVASQNLKTASHLFVTFGTSWIFREKDQNTIVGNCHKLPANKFNREKLSVEDIAGIWIPLLNNLFAIQPNLSVVLTISPIRHLKDGSFENQLSKSTLFLLIEQLLTHFGAEKITYFPSYELVMDELRDYRFYATDMLHLSETATAFIQEKFNEVFFDKESKDIIFKVGKIVKTLAHKPFQQENSAYQELLSKMEKEVEKIAFDHPGIEINDLIIDIVQKKSL
jgi:hypothetical protein